MLFKYSFTLSGQRIIFQKFRSFLKTIREYGWKAAYWKLKNRISNLALLDPSNDPGNWTAARKYIGAISIPANSYESHYEADEDFSGMKTDIKALAFYLPQFHTFPENDEWWHV